MSVVLGAGKDPFVEASRWSVSAVANEHIDGRFEQGIPCWIDIKLYNVDLARSIHSIADDYLAQ